MKSLTKNLMFLLLLIWTTGCGNQTAEEVPTVELKVEKQQISLEKGTRQSIQILSGNGEYRITVDEKGKDIASAALTATQKAIEVEGLNKGQTTITVADRKERAVQIEVNVYNPAEVNLDKHTISVEAGKKETVNILSGNQDYDIKLEGDGVAKASLTPDQKNIEIAGLAPGKTTMTITDKKSGTKAVLEITVFEWKALKLDKNAVTLQKGNAETVKIVSGNGEYTVSMVQGGEKKAKAELSDDKQGIIITGLEAGEAQAKITDTKSQAEAIVTITVKEEKKAEEPEIQQLKLGTNEITLEFNESKTIEIQSGNGSYTITALNGGDKIVQTALADGNKALTLKGIAQGKAQVIVRDERSNTTAEIKVKVYPLPIPHEKEVTGHLIDDVDKRTKHTTEELYQFAQKAVRLYDEKVTEINKLSPLPENKYKTQNAAWKEGKDLTEKNRTLLLTYNAQTEFNSLWKIAEDIYLYGYAYACIELMGRRAEKYNSQYGDQEVEQLISKTFDGLYTSQEGSDFYRGLNRDIVKGGYNKIVDRLNAVIREQIDKL